MTSLDLSAKYGETTLSNFEVFMMGEAFYRWVGATITLGHSSPGMALDYTKRDEAMGLPGLIMRDFVAWTSGRTHLVEGAEERLRELFATSNFGADMAERVGAALSDARAS